MAARVEGALLLMRIAFVLNLLATFLLDVLGGVGAMWGASDVFRIRATPNNDYWRMVCGVAALFFCYRWLCIRVLDAPIAPKLDALA